MKGETTVEIKDGKGGVIMPKMPLKDFNKAADSLGKRNARAQEARQVLDDDIAHLVSECLPKIVESAVKTKEKAGFAVKVEIGWNDKLGRFVSSVQAKVALATEPIVRGAEIEQGQLSLLGEQFE